MHFVPFYLLISKFILYMWVKMADHVKILGKRKFNGVI